MIAMGGAGCERNVGRLAAREDDRLARSGKPARRGGKNFGGQGLGAGRADQCGDMGHKDLNARNWSNRKDVQAVLVAGPTASGKSARAIALARDLGGIVINADSMAVYQDLPILSAAPTPVEAADVPHLLFGHIGAERNYSVGQWLADARAALDEAARRTLLPIFVGGTGMYFKALLHGLSNIPALPDAVRARIRAESEGFLPAELHAKLAARDPETAARLRPTDPQRILRALEIFEASGAPLATFQGARAGALFDPARCQCLFLAPPREALNARIDARFDRMLEAGALEEVRRLMARALDPSLPAMRAVGVPGLSAFLRGECSLAAAVEKSKRDSRHYAKRQFTFARTQLPEFEWVEAP
jgi:tRNA dimethylallyltransferase